MKIGEVTPIVAVSPSTETRTPVGDGRLGGAEKRDLIAAAQELGFPELTPPNRSLNIAYDRETRQSIVQIVDNESGEVLRQIPGKDVVERAKYYRELSGL